MTESKIKTTEVVAKANIGGRVQVVKFEYTESFDYGIEQTFTVEDMTEEEVEAFRLEQVEKLRDSLAPIGQSKVDDLQDMRDRIIAGTTEEEETYPDESGGADS
jgi:hypothetical protein